MSDQWAITDDNGVIYSGSENGMRDVWRQWDTIHASGPVRERKGDLKLIEIHEVRN